MLCNDQKSHHHCLEKSQGRYLRRRRHRSCRQAALMVGTLYIYGQTTSGWAKGLGFLGLPMSCWSGINAIVQTMDQCCNHGWRHKLQFPCDDYSRQYKALCRGVVEGIMDKSPQKEAYIWTNGWILCSPAHVSFFCASISIILAFIGRVWLL